MFDSFTNSITDNLSRAYKSIKGGVSQTSKAAWVEPPSAPPSGSDQYEINKYSVSQFTYPSDLMGEQYGGNYVIFYINVSEESRLVEKEDTFEMTPGTDPTMRNAMVANPLTKTQVAGGAAIVSGVTSLVSDLAKGKLSKDGLKKAGVSSAAKAAGGAAGVEVAGMLSPDKLRSQRRLKSAIALHVPNQLSVRYATTWGVENSSELDMASRFAQGLGNVMDAAMNGQGLSKAASGMAPKATEAAVNVALSKNKQPGMSSMLGVAANPKQTQTFQGVEFRTFSFDYQFFPRNADEAKYVLNIIHLFKFHMHPEYKGETDYVWLYPSEFDIMYYTGGVENTALHKHTSCILENIQINYTPNGNYNIFPNGMPTQINMTLSFKELQLATKETIGKTPGGGL